MEVYAVPVCVFGSRVVAENDFLHTLLNKVTASRGDSGGQGTVPRSQALLSLQSHVTVALLAVMCAPKAPGGLQYLGLDKMASSQHILASPRSLC